jgi:DNA recombination protein RmuC
MNTILFKVGGVPVSLLELAVGFAALTLLAVLVLARSIAKTNSARLEEMAAERERQHELDDKMADLGRMNAELSGRLQSMTEVLSNRQSELARTLGERLDHVGHRVGQGLEATAKSTSDNLAKLGERLAVIDAAQAKISGLTQEVVSLKDILSNKQSRGAFGQGRMEAIIRDGLPMGAYEFQYTLSNGKRPDCVLRLPGDPRVMVVDAKFPLEAFTALRDAAADDARQFAMGRVRNDLGKHVKDIAERYLLPGETQDMALLFVPSESIYADLMEHFDDVVQRAHRLRVVIVSPSLLMMAVQVTQALVRDAKMREQADVIQREVSALMQDVRRLGDRVSRLDQHFRQTQKDVEEITTSTGKILKRGERIEQVEVGAVANDSAAAPLLSIAE